MPPSSLLNQIGSYVNSPDANSSTSNPEEKLATLVIWDGWGLVAPETAVTEIESSPDLH